MASEAKVDSDGATDRVCNFSAGPSVLPLEVLNHCKEHLLSFEGSGQSVMEMSHRSKEFVSIYDTAVADLRAIGRVPDNFHIFMLQGGATMQFSSIPLNFNIADSAVPPQYIVSGGWSDKAFKEALKYNKDSECLFNTMGDAPPCTRCPDFEEVKVSDDAPYLYLCVNETVYGNTMRALPEGTKCPVVADYSSCFLSEPIPWDSVNFGVVYAGAQKNIGPAGLTVAIVRDDLIGRAAKQCPVLLDYATWKKKAIYNTPPCWSIYVMGRVMKWLRDTVGGLDKMKALNARKAKVIYDVMDEAENKGFYLCPVDGAVRSWMNIRFRCKDDADLEKKFIAEAAEQGMVNLKGHKSLGGCRASVYNAQPLENCQKLAAFMRKFREQNR